MITEIIIGQPPQRVNGNSAHTERVTTPGLSRRCDPLPSANYRLGLIVSDNDEKNLSKYKIRSLLMHESLLSLERVENFHSTET